MNAVKNKLKHLLCYAMLCMFLTIHAQETDVHNVMEDILSSYANDADYSEMLDDLQQYAQHPLNINSATAEELGRLHILTDFQINSVIDYRAKKGELISVFELQTVFGFDEELVKKLMPFITVAPADKIPDMQVKTIVAESRHRFITTNKLSTASSGNTLGNPLKHSLMYDGNYENSFRAGCRAEKDNGEQFFRGNNGYDHYSGFMSGKDIRSCKKFVIGDYHVMSGQGLILWSGMPFFISSDATNVRRYGGGIKEHTSFDENRFFRGAAATFEQHDIQGTVFLSHKDIDGNVTIRNRDGDAVEFSSLQTSGLHNTRAALDDKHAIRESVAGFNVQVNKRNFRTGVTMLSQKFSAMFRKADEPYNRFAFSGDNLKNAGIDYTYIYNNVILFGEEAWSSNGGMAFLNGIIANPVSMVSCALLQRYYGERFYAPYSSAFAQSATLSGERGLYMGLNVSPYKNIKISAYYDAYSFSWLRYSVNSPSKGNNYFAHIDYVGDDIKASLQVLHNENVRMQVTDGGNDIPDDVLHVVTKYRLHAEFQVLPAVRLRSRLEAVTYDEENMSRAHGFMMYQDARYTFSCTKRNCSLMFRYTLFDCDDYYARSYAYENDVLHSFSIPAYNNTGYKIYGIVDVKASRHIRLLAKISFMKYKMTGNDVSMSEKERYHNMLDGTLQVVLDF